MPTSVPTLTLPNLGELLQSIEPVYSSASVAAWNQLYFRKSWWMPWLPAWFSMLRVPSMLSRHKMSNTDLLPKAAAFLREELFSASDNFALAISHAFGRPREIELGCAALKAAPSESAAAAGRSCRGTRRKAPEDAGKIPGREGSIEIEGARHRPTAQLARLKCLLISPAMRIKAHMDPARARAR